MEKEYRFVNRFGRVYVEIRYKGEPWTGWLFKASEKPHKYWNFVPELGVYVSNVSI